MTTVPNKAVRSLAPLEEQIDDCPRLARQLDWEDLAHVIQLLRGARNEVVWKLGQEAVRRQGLPPRLARGPSASTQGW